MLPTNDKERKALPVFRGPMMYFPDAILELARVCKIGNDQHNPGEPLHWAREKSTEQMDTAIRHMMDHGLGNEIDVDGAYHLAKAAWRILAELQLTIEKHRMEKSISDSVMTALASTTKVAYDDPECAASLRALGDRAIKNAFGHSTVVTQRKHKEGDLVTQPAYGCSSRTINIGSKAAPGCCAVTDCAVCKRVAELDGAARDQGVKL